MSYTSSGNRARAVAITGGALLVGLIVRLLPAVEDGQFEREYSRLYTALVVGMGVMIFVTLIAVILGGVRALSARQ